MRASTCFLILLSTLFAAVLTGCNQEYGEEDPLADFPDLQLDSGSTADPSAEAPQEQLALKLKAGDRFPLIKTVDQQLLQAWGEGSALSTSRLELRLAISVDEVKAGRTRLNVRYDRVRFEQDLAGEKLVYDSQSPSNPVPAHAAIYQGMVNNGFSFWLGPDNKIMELVGFEQFLQRCVQHVPANQREEVLLQLTATTGDEGIANFVDDSIGLLPYKAGQEGQETAVRVGETWTQQRQFSRPLPMFVTQSYTLREMNEQTAEIDITGTIAPSAVYGPAGEQNVRLTVRGGHCLGNCTVDRQTGLPVQSRVERLLDMTVHPASGPEFQQRKQIVTTIRAFPSQGTTQPAISAVAPANAAGGQNGG